MIYAITYKVTERSTFQAFIDADDPDQALAKLREFAEDNGGDYTAPGTWVSTEGTDVDLDSIRVEVAE